MHLRCLNSFRTLNFNPSFTQLRPSYIHRVRSFNTSAVQSKKNDQLPPRPTLPDNDLKHAYLKGSGPGGQKINKTSSAVQLTHLPTGLVVKSQATRSRSQNHTIAKRILAEKIELLERGSESRAAKVVERKQRRKHSADKKKRRKYRKLEGEKDGDEDGLDTLNRTVTSEALAHTQLDGIVIQGIDKGANVESDAATIRETRSTDNEVENFERGELSPIDDDEFILGPDDESEEVWDAYVRRKGHAAYRSFTWFSPDGSRIEPDGIEVRPDGTEIAFKGFEKRDDGTEVLPDGTQLKPDGSVVKPDGTVLIPDDSAVLTARHAENKPHSKG